jgi:hypothetical protein
MPVITPALTLVTMSLWVRYFREERKYVRQWKQAKLVWLPSLSLSFSLKMTTW